MVLIRCRRPAFSIPGGQPVIYFLQDSASCLVKIGFALDVQSRVATLQTASPARLVLLACMDGDRHTEARLHQRFASARVRGEWFRPVPTLLSFLLAGVLRYAQAEGRPCCPVADAPPLPSRECRRCALCVTTPVCPKCRTPIV
jgi:hypothetical protein